jgi:hypothetical protein
LSLDGSTHATQLPLNEVFVDPQSTHGFGLNIELVLDIADTSVWIHQRSMGHLLLNESAPAGERER